MSGWCVINGLDWPGTFHVLPINDLRDHKAAQACYCRPHQDSDASKVWIHNSLDQRERFETWERKPS